MKKSLIIFAAFIMIAISSADVMAQVTASATGSAAIIAPITLSRTANMDFGNVAVIGAGTVILTPAGTRTKSGGVTLPVVTQTVTAAAFTVGGEGTSTYAITLPSSAYTITRLTGSETMTITAFTSTPTSTGALTGGTQTLTVGATLNVGATQVPGTYTNAVGFDVTVNYN